MTKAKVITLKVQMSKKKFANIVTAVDPSVTPELLYRVCGLRGKIVSAEETKAMLLPFALFQSFKTKVKLGII